MTGTLVSPKLSRISHKFNKISPKTCTYFSGGYFRISATFDFYSMPRKPKTISKNKIPEIASSLKAKASTPITVTLEDLVLSLAKPIQDMLDAGYSYSDVSAVFASHGVELAASGIKSYHKKSHISPPSSEPATEANEPTPDRPPETEQQPLPESQQQSESSSSKEVSPVKPSKASAKSKFNVTDRSKI